MNCIPAKFLANGLGWKFSDDARTQAERIRRAFLRAGYDDKMAMAAIANAMAESKLNPMAMFREASGNMSVGLFQLNDCARCAGAGMTVAQRQDPDQNIARILQVMKPTTLVQAWRAGADYLTLTERFTRDVERPADPDIKANERKNLAKVMFAKYFADKCPEVAPGAPSARAPSSSSGGDGGGAAIAVVAALLAGAVLLGR